MEKQNTSIIKLMPVLFGFFIMGFVDVVGISTSYVKQDFGLTDTVANILPMMVFLWFLLLSVPTGLLMNKIGRRKTVILSGVITTIAMLMPLTAYKFPVVIIAFSLLGIGNTILQVSLNPLVANVVTGERLTSSLTLGQFIKAIASALGPYIAVWAVIYFGNWKYLFPIFAGFTLLSTVWLLLTPIREESYEEKTSSFSASFSLLKDRTILLYFLGILMVVGVDVGLNTTIPKILMEKSGIALEKAGTGTSLYFIARTVGVFLGTFLLVKISGRKYFILNMIIAIAAMTTLFFVNEEVTIRSIIAVLGFTIASVFSIIFSFALSRKPEHHNEISGLMIMGVSGGAFITFLIGIASDAAGSQTGGIIVLLGTLVYLLFCAFAMKRTV